MNRNRDNRIGTAMLAALVLLLMQIGGLQAQPFVQLHTTSGGMYACEGLPMAVVAFPAQGFKGQGRWLVSHPDVLKTEGNVVALQPKQAGTSIQLTYELRLNDGTALDTTITLAARPTAHVAIEQQGDRLVVVGKDGHPAPTVYQWVENGEIVETYANTSYKNPKDGHIYTVVVEDNIGCVDVNVVEIHNIR